MPGVHSTVHDSSVDEEEETLLKLGLWGTID